MNKQNNFINAFSIGDPSCRGKCHCGKTYYDASDIDLSDDEITEFEKDENAIGVYESIGHISFGGKEYVQNCECWKPHAKTMMNFLDGYHHQIAAYLNAERQRMIDEAYMLPTVVQSER